MKNGYLELFQQIASKIDIRLKDTFGTDEAKEELKYGAFGDMTVYIDKIAEDIVLDAIENSNLKCSVLSEETGLVEFGDKLPIVVVDPIDGSLNAKRGLPYFSFSIALSEGLSTNDIVVGLVKNLSNKDEFYAIKGQGAYLNKKKIQSKSRQLNIVAVEGFKKNSSSEFVSFVYKHFNKVRQMGSMALDMCYLATGAFDVFLNVVPSRVIDYAAAKIILEEAGGKLYAWLSDKAFESSISQEKGGLFFALSDKKLIDEFLSLSEGMR